MRGSRDGHPSIPANAQYISNNPPPTLLLLFLLNSNPQPANNQINPHRNAPTIPLNQPPPPFSQNPPPTVSPSMSLKNGKQSKANPNVSFTQAQKLINPHRKTADAFPSSEAFDAINAALSSSEADRKDAIKNGKAVFAFTLKNKAGETASWHIDLKETGTVGTGLGENPTGTGLYPFLQTLSPPLSASPQYERILSGDFPLNAGYC